MNAAYTWTGIVVMALVTYVIRMIPMAFFSKPIQSKFFKSFLYYVPYAVLSAMTFPAVFSADLPLAVSAVGVLAAIVCAWFGGSLLVVAAVAAAAAYVTLVLI
ncbi:AzlD domain-containing protein [Erysipelotrichaceae bacterium RD49]|nr:AzlD domain-containing protein [Erysipelotrichaceae bacterium RD49]